MSLSYLAPSDCPTADGYLSHVRARSTALAPELRELPGSDSVDVRLEPDLERSGWLGLLRIEGSRPLEREVRGERCADVVEALALITVLRLEGGDAVTITPAPGATSGAVAPPAAPDTAAPAVPAPPGPSAASPGGPEAPETPEPEAPETPEPAAPEAAPTETPDSPSAPDAPPVEPAQPPPSPSEPPPAPAPPAEPPSPPAPSEPPEPAAPPLDEPRPAPPERVETPAPEAGVASGAPSEPLSVRWAPTLALLVGYATVPGHALDATLASEVRYGEALGSWTSPISLGVSRGSERVEAADLDFTVLLAQLGVCPPALLAEPWAWLRVCANVRGGAVLTQITPRLPAIGDNPQWRPWLALLPSLELGIPLSRRWTFRAGAELAVQLVRDTFGAPLDAGPDPDFLPLYRPDALSFEAALGVGYTF